MLVPVGSLDLVHKVSCAEFLPTLLAELHSQDVGEVIYHLHDILNIWCHAFRLSAACLLPELPSSICDPDWDEP